MEKTIFTTRAFPDVEMENIDYDKDSRVVIERIINNGTFEDFNELRRFYGDKRIRKDVVYAKDFGPKEVSFCCLLFKLKPKDFKFPVTRPAYPEPWDFSGA